MTKTAQVGTKADMHTDSERVQTAREARNRWLKLRRGVPVVAIALAKTLGAHLAVVTRAPGAGVRREHAGSNAGKSSTGRRSAGKTWTSTAGKLARDAGLLLVLTAASIPVQAQTDVTLVSNVGASQLGSSQLSLSSLTQEFTTGNRDAGYNLSSIEVHIQGSGDSPAFPTMRLYSDIDRGTLVDTLTAPSGSLGGKGNYRFTASENIVLAKDTSYRINLEGGSGIWYATGPHEDSNGAAGWSIDDNTVDNQFGSLAGFAWMIRVNGYALNRAPAFTDATLTRAVAENSTADTNVGEPIPEATDPDGDTPTYTMEGTDAALFTFDATNRQIKTKDGVTYDFETGPRYEVTIKADDTNGGTDTVDVTINLTDVDEPPTAPAAPTVTATSGSTTSLDVSWTEPTNTGKPPITSYDVQYREGTSGNFTAGPQDVTTTATTISTGLTAGTAYQVQVRASNDEGDSDWSDAGSGSTSTGAHATLSSATVPASGALIELRFSETIDGSRLPPPSAFVVTAGGSARTVTDVSVGTNGILVGVSPTILQGETVSVTYTDPTSGNDTNALQDTAGNDVATFTATATNNSTLTNHPATGGPEIHGSPIEGRTLSAHQGTIADVDGLPTTTFPTGYSLQWRRGGTDIAGATSRRYTVVAADVGHKLTVQASFTDRIGNSESRPSWETETVMADTTAPTLRSARVLAGDVLIDQVLLAPGTVIDLVFSETMQAAKLPAASAVRVTVDGTRRTVMGRAKAPKARDHDTMLVWVSPRILRGETVVVTYTDPSASNDANAFQDVVGNDVASFTTGVGGVPAVINSSVMTIRNMTATVDEPFTYTFPTSTFAYTRAGDTYSAVLEEPAHINRPVGTDRTKPYERNKLQPGWLRFDPATRTFSGTPLPGSNGNWPITIRKHRPGKPGFHEVTFDINVGVRAGLASNFSNPGIAGRNLRWFDHAQRFRTGGASNGYAITSVDLLLSNVGNTGNLPTVKLRSGTANGGSTDVVTLTPPNQAESRTRTYRYTAESETTLMANTTYWLVVTDGMGTIHQTGSASLDPGSATGWAMIPVTYLQTSEFGPRPRGSWTASTYGGVTTMRINGTVASMQHGASPPTITRTPVLSGAGEDGTWSESETVGVALTFSENVNVDTSGGTPLLGIDLGAGGSATRSAHYESGSGTATLNFGYTLLAGDGTHRAMAVTPDSLALNGGSIRSSATAFDALLGHNGTAAMGTNARSTGPQASFHDVPQSHDGESAFTLSVGFGGAPDGLSPKRDAGSTLEVEGGAITKARQAPGQASGTWELTVTPAGMAGVRVRVPVRSCAEAHAVCINGRPLTEAAETTIAGHAMSAHVTSASASHDGSGTFDIEFEFSHEPHVSYRTIRDDFFDVTDGRIVRAKRLTRSENLGWRLTVQPDGNGAVTIDARATSDCEAAYAVCDAEGRMFDGALVHTVPGPAPVTPTVVSIAAGEALVNEGTDLTFTLSRTDPIEAALAVNVTVSDKGDVLASSPPTSVSFAAGAATATLSVATVDDETEEDTTRVTATLAAGSGYEINADASTAEGYVESEDLAPITASFTKMVDEHRGSGTFSLRFAFSHEMPEYSYRTVHRHLFDVTGGTIKRTRRLVPGSSLSWEIAVAPQGFDPVTLAARATTDCAAEHAACDPFGRKFDGNLSTTIVGPPTLSVADATVEEDGEATLDFVVTLSRALDETVTVGYATADGTASAGADYTETSGTLTFAENEIEKTVSVPVLDDAHDEGSETMTFTLSSPDPERVKLEDASAEGIITNDDRMPQAWTARFGRTVAEQAIDAVEERLTTARTPGLSGSFAGVDLAGLTGETQGEETAEIDGWRDAPTLSEWVDDDGGDGPEPEARTFSGHELLTGSSFALTTGSAQSGFASFWGRGAVTRFEGREDDLKVDGEVASTMLGADVTRDALSAGLMLAHTRGEGGYHSEEGSGTVESTLTTLFPYGRMETSERLSLWAMAGYGEGTLTLTPDGEPALRPDLSFLMGAVGARSVLVGREGQAMLALKSDAMAARTSTDAVTNPEGGNLAASEADVTRLRLALEGSRPMALGESTVLTPSLEVGLRHDGGDAETGFGADIGVGLALSDAARGITSEIRARGLLTHEAEGFGERGLSGTLSFDPRPSDERGLAVSLTQTMGGPATGGADALIGRTTLAGLGANDDAGLDARQLDARVGYGFGVFEHRYTSIPELGLGLSEHAREMRLGWRLAERRSAGLAFELGVEGTRLEDTSGATDARHGLTVGAGWRLMARGTESFELRLEAGRHDAANDDPEPEHSIGVRLGARW